MASHRDKMDHDLRFGDPADWSEEKANKEEFEEDGFGEGVKYDAGKPSIARLPSRAVFEIARVFKHGADKYDDTNRLDDNNWRYGMRWSRLHDAALRHIFAHKQGEDLDQDSGLNHLAHAACSLMMLLRELSGAKRGGPPLPAARPPVEPALRRGPVPDLHPR